MRLKTTFNNKSLSWQKARKKKKDDYDNELVPFFPNGYNGISLILRRKEVKEWLAIEALEKSKPSFIQKLAEKFSESQIAKRFRKK